MKSTKPVFIMLIVALIVLLSCVKDSTGPNNVKPEKPTNPSPEDNKTNVSLTTTISWDCVDQEGDSLTYDVYFGTSSNPSIVNSRQSNKTYDPGTLIGETTYYWKIVANDNHSNTTTGDIWQFTTTVDRIYGTVTDIDGNVYQTLMFGDQEWMIENLKVTRYRDGTPIKHVTDWRDWKDNLPGAAYCYYDNDPVNADIYGNLYNFYAVFGGNRKVLAPEGWRVSSDRDIQILEMYLGMPENKAKSLNTTYARGTNEGSKLAGGYNLWANGRLRNDPEFGSSGFNFLPGGLRNQHSGMFEHMGVYGYLWSSSHDSGSLHVLYRRLHYDQTYISRSSSANNYMHNQAIGMSVRCVRN